MQAQLFSVAIEILEQNFLFTNVQNEKYVLKVT